MNLDYKSIVVFDFETTGLNPLADEVLEIGAIRLEKQNGVYEIKNRLSCIIKQAKPIPETITRITNIDDELVRREGIDKSLAFSMFQNLIDPDTLLIAYNIHFDIRFLIRLYQTEFDPNYQMKNDLLDVMAVYKDFHPYPHKLESATQTYPVEAKNSHRALDDVLATYQVLLEMEKKIPETRNLLVNLKNFINVIGFNPKYPVPFSERLPHIKYVAHWPNQQLINKKR